MIDDMMPTEVQLTNISNNLKIQYNTYNSELKEIYKKSDVASKTIVKFVTIAISKRIKKLPGKVGSVWLKRNLVKAIIGMKNMIL